MSVPTGTRGARLEWVEVLRGGASLAVVLFHSMIVLWVGLTAFHGSGSHGNFDRLAAYLSWPAHYGYVGVMLFFVLSGFVIHLPYAGGERPLGIRAFYVRRFVRLYPPYAAALALSILVASHVHVDRHATLDASTLVRSFVFLQNYPHLGGKVAELAWLQPAGNIALWSLPVEFELYLVYPIVLHLTRRFGLSIALASIAGVSLVATFADIFIARPSGQTANVANYLPTFLHYWIVWFAGAWLAERFALGAAPRWNVAWTVVFVASTALAIVDRQRLLPFDVGDFVIALVFVSAIVWILSNEAHSRRFARLGPLAKIGDFSYSLYLIHMPILLIILALWERTHPIRPTNYLASVVAVVLIIPIAFGFWYLFEKPSIALAKRLSRNVERRRPSALQAELGFDTGGPRG